METLTKQIKIVDEANHNKRGVFCMIKQSKNNYVYGFISSPGNGVKRIINKLVPDTINEKIRKIDQDALKNHRREYIDNITEMALV